MSFERIARALGAVAQWHQDEQRRLGQGWVSTSEALARVGRAIGARDASFAEVLEIETPIEDLSIIDRDDDAEQLDPMALRRRGMRDAVEYTRRTLTTKLPPYSHDIALQAWAVVAMVQDWGGKPPPHLAPWFDLAAERVKASDGKLTLATALRELFKAAQALKTI